MKVDPKRWYFVQSEYNAFYDVEIEGKRLNAIPDEKTYGGLAHYKLMLLIDPNRNIRGIYDGSEGEGTEYLRLTDELWLLHKEFNKNE